MKILVIERSFGYNRSNPKKNPPMNFSLYNPYQSFNSGNTIECNCVEICRCLHKHETVRNNFTSSPSRSYSVFLTNDRSNYNLSNNWNSINPVNVSHGSRMTHGTIINHCQFNPK